MGGNNETTPGIGYINSVEIYSPEGGCQYRLADIPYEGDYIYWPGFNPCFRFLICFPIKHSVYEHCITTSLEAQKGDSDSYLLKIILQKRSHYELVSAILGRFKVL